MSLPIDDPKALRRLIQARLKDTLPHPDLESAARARALSAVNTVVRDYLPRVPLAAAVLVPIIDREASLSVLLTRRASHLRHHAGQISFPGGRIEPDDDGPIGAALREAEEEIGLTPEHVSFAGYLDPQLVVSGFWVTPVVGFVRSDFALALDPQEVSSTFEVPLAHVLDTANHIARERTLGTQTLPSFDIPFGPYVIWGATAGMLMELYRVLREDV